MKRNEIGIDLPESEKICPVTPVAYLTDVIEALPFTPADQFNGLLPHIWIGSHPKAALPPVK